MAVYLLCALALMGSALLWAGLSHVPRRRLPDGTWLELRDWKTGINPKLDERGGWWKLAPRSYVGPAFVFNPNPVSRIRDQTPMLHLLVSRTPVRRAVTQAYGALTDEHGCWFEPTISDQGLSRAGGFQVLRFKPLPADSKLPTLGFYDSEARGAVVSFGAPLRPPSGSPTKLGTPLPLPLTVQAGDTAFTLTSLTHRNSGMHYREVATFRARSGGQVSKAWTPVAVTATDASGATMSSGQQEHPLYTNADGEFRFSGLCRKAAAWELKVTFRRPNGRGGVVDRRVAFIVKP